VNAATDRGVPVLLRQARQRPQLGVFAKGIGMGKRSQVTDPICRLLPKDVDGVATFVV